MTGKDMLRGLSYIGDDLIENTAATKANSLHRKTIRALQIAALISIMLLMMGCAVAYILHLQDLKIAERTVSVPIYDENYQVQGYQETQQDIFSLTGLKGTANYNATAEWFAFKDAFDPNNDIQNAYYENPERPTFPEKYDAYWPYSQEMVDKIDALAKKYDLKLLGSLTQYQEEADFLTGIGIPRLLRDDKTTELRFQNGHKYGDGNWGCVFELEPTDETENWPPYLFGSIKYYDKSYLDTEYWSLYQIDMQNVWNQDTPSGENVLVVFDHTEFGAYVFCDRPEGTILLMLSSLQKPVGDVESQQLTREQLEKLINAFDFESYK